MPEAYPVGQLVHITHPGQFHDMYGTIVKVHNDTHPDGLYEIEFGSEYRWMFGAFFGEENYIRFMPDDFVFVKDMPPKLKAELMCKRANAHTVKYFADIFVPGSACQHEDCSEQATGRIFVNYWGTLVEVEVCDVHRSYEMKMMEEMPFKSKARANV